ncbi:MAG: hypothetical protein AMXMBFR7_47670 [Planctomycetota bacterium]
MQTGKEAFHHELGFKVEALDLADDFGAQISFGSERGHMNMTPRIDVLYWGSAKFAKGVET